MFLRRFGYLTGLAVVKTVSVNVNKSTQNG